MYLTRVEFYELLGRIADLKYPEKPANTDLSTYIGFVINDLLQPVLDLDYECCKEVTEDLNNFEVSESESDY